MRRCFELIVLATTAVILVATSQARNPCAVETISLRAQTTCGPDANVAVVTSTGCGLTATGADFGGLPTLGSISGSFADAGLGSGFQLAGITADGGAVQTCVANPADAGFTIVCTPTCGFEPDAGACEASCSGTLTPQ